MTENPQPSKHSQQPAPPSATPWGIRQQLGVAVSTFGVPFLAEKVMGGLTVTLAGPLLGFVGKVAIGLEFLAYAATVCFPDNYEGYTVRPVADADKIKAHPLQQLFHVASTLLVKSAWVKWEDYQLVEGVKDSRALLKTPWRFKNL